jgi:NADPH-dependent 2,4-dienoyl-CoA reductase/sulfur reductase-like enzyme
MSAASAGEPPMQTVVIVGAGPAGVRAAATLAAAGLRPIVIDESPAAGGQIYRQPPPAKRRRLQDLYGFEWKKAAALHQTMEQLCARDAVEYLPGTMVWNCRRDMLDLYHPERGHSSIRFDRLILATGAMDRIAPLPGWENAGVYTTGAAQIALKAQGCLLGSRPIFAGTGPLLYLVAYQYAKAGATIAAVIDTTPLLQKIRALSGLAARPSMMFKGFYYLLVLYAKGVRVVHGAQLTAIDGEAGDKRLHWKRNARESSASGDTVCIGHGLRSETQLADLAECAFEFSAVNRQWLPRRDAAGRTSNPNVYITGDGAGILGAEAAEHDGRQSALAVLQDIGIVAVAPPPGTGDGASRRFHRFRNGLEHAFGWPANWAGSCSDATVICRCEGITAGQIRHAVSGMELKELNRVKAITRCGMGRCQGRVCGAAAAEIAALAAGLPLNAVGRFRTQAPVKPIPFQSGSADDAVAAKGNS